MYTFSTPIMGLRIDFHSHVYSSLSCVHGLYLKDSLKIIARKLKCCFILKYHFFTSAKSIVDSVNHARGTDGVDNS